MRDAANVIKLKSLNLKNCSTTKGTPSTPVTLCPACRNHQRRTGFNDDYWIKRISIRLKYIRIPCLYEKLIYKIYLVEVHEVASFAAERDEEPHARLTLFNLRLYNE